MDTNTMMLLGVVKLLNPTTKQPELFDAKGFDVLGFFFPFLRYAISGMWSKAFLTLAISCTIIGYPIMSWLTAFNFRKYRIEHLLKKGWTIVQEDQHKKTA
ncbi:MAG: hypothetical protein ACK41T_08450 [Pseudobdellovibrio sp.]